MISTKINAAASQLTLDFEPGLVDRYRNARECVAQGVYQRGLKRVAMDLDQAPGNLSSQLADDTQRHFSLDSFERYLETSGDMTPLYYLCEKFLGDKRNAKQAALEQLQAVAPDLIDLLKRAGLKG
ncbi:hypothetical protein [Burkholderia thailandensis]|uniref:hypothetical protein n=1 Tax=Burkholderia thailandensis TaxID=57975 RepID=UPI00107EE76D|nr:hypothetical protein [Burkholderia thailandensis]TGB34380.1 hypothetical protein C6946_07055 [Burkholderia thailandensis]